VIYYLIAHQDATNIISKPTARENYAYPFIIWQMLYLTLFIDRYKSPTENPYQRNYGLVSVSYQVMSVSIPFFRRSMIVDVFKSRK
jgi:hypothetical protein